MFDKYNGIIFKIASVKQNYKMYKQFKIVLQGKKCENDMNYDTVNT